MSLVHHETGRAPDQTIGIAGRTDPEGATLFSEHFMASIAFVAHNESQPSAETARDAPRQRQPFDQLMQLAAVVESPHFVCAANVGSGDENAWKRHGAAAENLLQLLAEAFVDTDVALVDGDGEAAEDGSDGAAVVVGAADDAEAGVVEDDGGTVGVRRRRKGGRGGGAGAAEGTEEGGGDGEAAEKGGRFGRARFGFGSEEGLDVFEGSAGDGGGSGSGSVGTRSCSSDTPW